MELRAGYKKTEVGVIPEDWEIKTLNETSKIIGGGTPSTTKSIFWNGDINWFTPTEIGRNKYSNESLRKLTLEGLENSSARILPIGTILLTTRAGIGDVSILNIEAATNQGFQSFIVNKNISNEYLYYLISTLKNVFLQNASGSTFLEISPNKLKAIQIVLPPIKEQTAIAAALSDTDCWITSLEQLIAKKRLLKQGAMQELLEPKEGWEVKKLGDVAEIYTGKKNNQDKVENGKYPFFVRSQNIESINSYSFDGEAILIPGEGNIGKIFHYINGKFDYHQRVYKISNFKNGYLGMYIYRYISEYFGRHAMEHSVKATVDSLRLPTFQIFQIPFPRTIEEQTRIATILSDMDSELMALENKLEKAKKIKLGMMQELLTGKIRLVVP